ncbi:cyclase family protein [Flavobacterium sp. N1719]|uniref:cyclase family protein n=1 Tax=Flavobacterium sp. N1719 TaxID=2885633 RepID=UPI0022239A69|nr:cyclase family protein [Flavobacterium sp. N1719]
MKYLFFLSTVLITSCTKNSNEKLELNNLNWIDLTYSFDSTTLYWPNNKTTFEHHTDANGITRQGYYYSSYSICAPEHGGTHLDAPIHFAKGKYTVDQIPLKNLTGNAVVIDVSKNALANRDYQISIADITNWELENGEIQKNTIILFKTGYGKYYPNRGDYFGTPKTGIEAIPELHFPGIDPETTLWLIKERAIKAIGLDTPSLDYGQSTDFKTHQILMGNNKPGFENLANLDQLPATKIYVVALPMKIGKGSGAPLRIIAGIAN